MIARALVAICLFLLPALAQAHLLPKQNATLRIIDKAAFVVVAVPVSALDGVDDDANGKLSLAELERHNADIARQFGARFHVSDNGVKASQALTMVMSPLTDGETYDTDYAVVLHRVNFVNAPQNPSIDTDLFGTGRKEGQMRVKASRGETVEIAILEPGATHHVFFRGSLAVFVDFIRIGFEHIWTGYDHLLFLLTIVMIGASLRYWFAVVSSFTIAHSITLALSTLGVLRIDPAIVEPGIALSIVVMALLNLRVLAKHRYQAGWSRVAIVFACGLLHGFGFGSAVGSMALDANNRFATLAGFNIGIEIGQFLFVGAVLAVTALLAKIAPPLLVKHIPRAASIFAAIMGTTMLIGRMTG